jgi:hypothetical protein
MFAVKQNFGGIPDLISSVAQQELKDLPPYVKECAIVYIPEIGYLLSLPPWKQPMSDEDWNIPGIEFLVCSFHCASLFWTGGQHRIPVIKY